jgi:hypothetical protein
MSVDNLVFTVVSSGEKIYDPLKLGSSKTSVIKVTNFSETDVEDIGVFIVPATNLGAVDFPADMPPESDYQDLLTWGTDSALGLAAQGGLKLIVPQDAGPATLYCTRTQGFDKRSKIPMSNIPAGQSLELTVELETPPAVSARRLFVDVVVE